MTDHEPNPIPPIEILIDRIVDGGLTPAELRKAVERLESSGDGWRRCALAFLEAQSWGETLRYLNETQREDESGALLALCEPRSPASIPLSTRHPGVLRRAFLKRALAAGITALAFALGWIGRDLNSGSPDDHGALVSRSDGFQESRPETRESKDAVLSAELSKSVSAGGLPADPVPQIQEIGRLHVGSDTGSIAEVPILDGPGIDPRSLLDQPAPISEHRLALWQRQGYQFDQRRSIVAVPLADGRQAAVPVDQIRVRYVGRDAL